MAFHISEILGKTKVYDNKVTVAKKVREIFNIRDGDELLWAINKDGLLILTNTSIDDSF